MLMKVLFLDQNKWIDLARVASGASPWIDHTAIYDALSQAIDSRKLIVPLSMAHIIETSKVNDPSRRRQLAYTQSKFSGGFVFRSRKARLQQEIQCALKKAFGEPMLAVPDAWFIAKGFMQAFEQFDDHVAPSLEIARNALFNSHIDAAEMLFNFLTTQDDANRRKGILAFSQGSDELVNRIERRREKLK